MADNKPTEFSDPVEIPETLGTDITETRIDALLERAVGEEAFIAEKATKDLADTRRVRALRVFIAKLNEVKAEFEADRAEAAAAEQAAEQAAAEAKAAEEAVAAEQAAAEEAANAEGTKLEVIEGEGQGVTPEEQAALEQQNADEAMAAGLAGNGPAAGTGTQHQTDTGTPLEVIDGHLGRQMFAANGSARSMVGEGGMEAGLAENTTNMSTVGARLRGHLDTAATVQGEDVQYLFRTNANAGKTIDRMGMQAELNAELVAKAGRDPEAMMAALCGIPQLVEGRGVCCDNDRPVAASFAGQAIDVGTGKFQWYKNWSAADLEGTMAQVWRECEQAKVDPADKATWKPCATLPGCEDTCSAKAWWLTGCVKISIEDEMSRADRVQDAYSLVDCQLAEIADSHLLRILDFYSRGRLFDAAALGTLGSAAAFPIAMAGIVQRLASIRQYGGGAMWTAYVSQALGKNLALDMHLAGEDGSMAQTKIDNLFALCGVTDVVYTKDFGCEGALVPDFDDNPKPGGEDASCALDVCDFTDDCTEAPFGAGAPVETVTKKFRIRLVQKQDFRFGQTNVFDYSLRRSPELMAQNCAEYRGETAEILFKTGSCAPSFYIDIDNLCPTGDRVDRLAVVPCDAVAAKAAAAVKKAAPEKKAA